MAFVPALAEPVISSTIDNAANNGFQPTAMPLSFMVGMTQDSSAAIDNAANNGIQPTAMPLRFISANTTFTSQPRAAGYPIYG